MISDVINRFKQVLYGDELEKRLQELYAKLRTDEEIVSLSVHPGWIRLTDVLNKTVADFDVEIIRLAERPVENRDRLIWLRANRDAMLALMGIVNHAELNVKSINETIVTKLKKLEDVAMSGVPLKRRESNV